MTRQTFEAVLDPGAAPAEPFTAISRPLAARAYLIGALAACLCVLACVGAVNALIDPQGRFAVLEIDGLNTAKTHARLGKGSVRKAIILERNSFDTVVLGSSRSEMGIDPRSPVFDGRRVFNTSLSKTSMLETAAVMRHVLATQRPELVLWGLDFSVFSSHRDVTGDFTDSRFACTGVCALRANLVHLLSAATLDLSIQTVRSNRWGPGGILREDGYLDQSHEQGRVDHRSLFTAVLEDNFLARGGAYREFRYSAQRMAMFRDALVAASQRGVRMKLFISPVHARQLEAIRVSGLAEEYSRWQRELVAVVREVNVQGGSRAIELWDFSGYHEYAMERIPLAGSSEPMRWYWESSHYTKALGDLMLTRMFASDGADDGFGVRMGDPGFASHLTGFWRGSDSFRATQPEEVEEVERIGTPFGSSPATGHDWASRRASDAESVTANLDERL